MRYGIVSGMGLRENLRNLMDSLGENPNSLSSKAKVPQPTIHRILDGTSQDPRRATLEPLAKYFGVTVDELCGDIRAPHTSITQEQQQMIALMSNLDKDAREALLKMGSLLARRPVERRKRNFGNNPERRIGPDIPPDAQDTRLHEHEPIDETEQSKEIKKK